MSFKKSLYTLYLGSQQTEAHNTVGEKPSSNVFSTKLVKEEDKKSCLHINVNLHPSTHFLHPLNLTQGRWS